MKRMSEVFELPLAVEENQGEPLLSDAPCYFESFDEDGKGSERAKHAAHAINHVDALADALENLVSDYERHVELYGTDLTDDDCARIDKKMKDGRAALNAYRGKA